MARSINQVIMLGNLTRNPEMRTTTNGTNVTSFSLALNRSYKGQNGEWQEDTDFIDCVAWAQLGERVNQYLSKGRRCLVQGRLSQRSWDDKDSGQKRSKVEVVAFDVTFLDGGNGGNNSGGNQTTDSSSKSSASTAKSSKKKDDDVAIEDIDDKPIDLSEIPF